MNRRYPRELCIVTRPAQDEFGNARNSNRTLTLCDAAHSILRGENRMKIEPVAETSSKKERRHAQRRKFTAKIEIEWGSSVLVGMVRDIGPRGLFIELTPQLWMGATFVARLAVDPVLSLNCSVTRVEPGKGIGVAFTHPDGRGEAQFGALLASLPLT
jgi:PilZ domain